MDSLSENDVTLLHQAIAYRRASRLANAVYSINNVMTCIKALMLEGNSPIFTTTVDSSLDEEENMNNNNTRPADADRTITDTNNAANGHNSDASTTGKGEVKQDATLPTNRKRSPSKSTHNQQVEGKVNKRKTLPKQIVNSEAMFTCERCGYQTKRKDHFKRHCMSHASEKPIKCSLCTFSCVDNYHLVRHLNSSVHHNRGKQEELKCDSCDYKTNFANRMLRHVRTHNGEKPFACSYCAYKAAQKATLERHILTHTGEKPYKCESCEYSAADTKSLRFHTLQKHAKKEETLHKCPQCDYSTPVFRYFKLHMRAHSDARPYLCDICGYSSKRPHGLTKHYRAVHGWSKDDTDGKQWRREPIDKKECETQLSVGDKEVTSQEHMPDVITRSDFSTQIVSQADTLFSSHSHDTANNSTTHLTTTASTHIPVSIAMETNMSQSQLALEHCIAGGVTPNPNHAASSSRHQPKVLTQLENRCSILTWSPTNLAQAQTSSTATEVADNSAYRQANVSEESYLGVVLADLASNTGQPRSQQFY